MGAPIVTAHDEHLELSIIIVNWNARQHLGRCIGSALQDIIQVPAEVLLMDNASTDGSVDFIRTIFPSVHLLTNSANLGFAVAINQAVLRACGRYFMLLNPDTEILPGAIPAMLSFADEHRDIGVLGPRILNEDRSLQRSCWRNYPDLAMALVDAFYLWKLPRISLAHRFEYDSAELDAPLVVDHLLGACLLVRREAWLDVGPLDESFFLYFEETDWCRRAKQAGWRVIYYPHAAIVHYGQRSAREQPASSLPHFYRSYCHFYRKWHRSGRPAIGVLKAIFVVASILRVCIWTIRFLTATSNEQRALGRRMVRGYGRVLTELPSF